MSGAYERSKAMDGVQGFVALLGITLGVIPLARLVVTGEFGGLFAWIFGAFAENAGYLAPLTVIVASVAAIGVLEVLKKRV